MAASEAPEGLASQRPWTAFSSLDVDRATPALRRLATNAERQAGCLLISDLVSQLIDRIDNVRESQKIADDFTKRYLKESVKLAEAIGDADPELKQELLEVIAACM